MSVDYHGSVLFVMIDIDELTDLALSYQINSIPTFIIIKGGAVVEVLDGNNASYETLLSKLNEYKE
jgi:thioredoxin-like negative regulator of GroEL